MERKLNLGERLDFTDIDLTAPEEVIKGVLNQLPNETNNIIWGKIDPYAGHVFSYKKSGFSGIAEALGTADKTVDIQDSLGKVGEESHKFECYLYTPEYEKYKYRVFFIKYDIANYPVEVILDDSVSKSVFGRNSGYIHTCHTREELEELVYNVFNSKRLVTVMQELIRINQAKKLAKIDMEANQRVDAE